MKRVKFIGFETGVRKIRFISLLHEKGGLKLSEAKNIKDKVIGEGLTVEVNFKNSSTAMLIYNESQAIGLKCELIG